MRMVNAFYASAVCAVWSAIDAPVRVDFLVSNGPGPRRVDRRLPADIRYTLTQKDGTLSIDAVSRIMGGFIAWPIAERERAGRDIESLWDYRVADPFVVECIRLLRNNGYQDQYDKLFQAAIAYAEILLEDVAAVWDAADALSRLTVRMRILPGWQIRESLRYIAGTQSCLFPTMSTQPGG